MITSDVVPPSSQANNKGDLTRSRRRWNEKISQEMSIETGEVQLETMNHKRNPKHGITGKQSTYSVAPSHFDNTPANN
jgi:hypothetical protein